MSTITAPFIEEIRRLEEVVEQAKIFLNAVEASSKDSEGVFIMAQIHGMPYKGRTFGKELEAFKEALKQYEAKP